MSIYLSLGMMRKAWMAILRFLTFLWRN